MTSVKTKLLLQHQNEKDIFNQLHKFVSLTTAILNKSLLNNHKMVKTTFLIQL